MFQVTGVICGIIGKFSTKTPWRSVQLLPLTSMRSYGLKQHSVSGLDKATEIKNNKHNMKARMVEEKKGYTQELEVLLKDVEAQKIPSNKVLEIYSAVNKIMTEQDISDKVLTQSDNRYAKLKAMVNDFKASENAEALKAYKNLGKSGILQLLRGLTCMEKKNVDLAMALLNEICQYTPKMSEIECIKLLQILVELDLPNKALLAKIGDRLVTFTNMKLKTLGGLATTLGMLKYRDARILDAMCNSFLYGSEIVTPNTLQNVLYYFATIGYKTPKVKIFINELIFPLQESQFADKSKWINVVWSLVVLNMVKDHHYHDIFSEKFLNQIKVEKLPKGSQLKLLNIRAAAKIHFGKDDALPSLNLSNVQLPAFQYRTKMLKVLEQSLQEVLQSSDYTMNIDTGMGFNIDAMCYLNSEMKYGSMKNPNAKKVAIMLNLLSDYTRQDSHLLGKCMLQERLLHCNGYSVISISEKSFGLQVVPYKRIKYLAQQLYNKAVKLQSMLKEEKQ